MRLLSESNEQLGLLPFEEALAKAESAGLDLVEMAGKVDPPVCRIMDYGKFKYEEDKRQKTQAQQKVKELKFHLQIDDNDFNTKVNHSLEFLRKGDKVKVLVAFRGREMSHPELGQQLVAKIISAVGDNAVIDSPAKMLGKNCQMILAPNTKKKKTADNAEQKA